MRDVENMVLQRTKAIHCSECGRELTDDSIGDIESEFVLNLLGLERRNVEFFCRACSLPLPEREQATDDGA